MCHMQHRNQLGLWVAMVAIAAACTAAAAAPHPTTGQEAAVLSKAADLASKAANLANKEKGVLMVKLIGFPKTPVQQPGCSQNSQGKGFVFNNILSHLGKFKGNGQPCAASPSPLPPVLGSPSPAAPSPNPPPSPHPTGSSPSPGPAPSPGQPIPPVNPSPSPSSNPPPSPSFNPSPAPSSNSSPSPSFIPSPSPLSNPSPSPSTNVSPVQSPIPPASPTPSQSPSPTLSQSPQPSPLPAAPSPSSAAPPLRGAPVSPSPSPDWAENSTGVSPSPRQHRSPSPIPHPPRSSLNSPSPSPRSHRNSRSPSPSPRVHSSPSPRGHNQLPSPSPAHHHIPTPAPRPTCSFKCPGENACEFKGVCFQSWAVATCPPGSRCQRVGPQRGAVCVYKFKPAAERCYTARGACERHVMCSGVSGVCPTSKDSSMKYKPAGDLCAEAKGDCGAQSSCDGKSSDCPLPSSHGNTSFTYRCGRDKFIHHGCVKDTFKHRKGGKGWTVGGLQIGQGNETIEELDAATAATLPAVDVTWWDKGKKERHDKCQCTPGWCPGKDKPRDGVFLVCVCDPKDLSCNWQCYDHVPEPPKEGSGMCPTKPFYSRLE